MAKPEKYDFSGWATKNDLKCADGRTIRHGAFKEDDGKGQNVHQHDEHPGQFYKKPFEAAFI